MKAIKIISDLLILSVVLSSSCIHYNGNQVLTPAYRANLIDSLLNSAVNNNEIPGAVAFICRNGKEVFQKAYGYRNLEKKIHMKADDIFRMASMTKALTAVAVLQLCERGLLFLYVSVISHTGDSLYNDS